MRNTKKWLVFLLCAMMLVNTLGISAAAVENESPIALSAAVSGSTVELQILATEAQTVSDGKLVLTFDAEKLTYAGIEQGAAWGSDEIVLSVNSKTGKVILTFASVNTAAEGVLFTLTFDSSADAVIALDGSSYLTGVKADLAQEVSTAKPAAVIAEGWSGYTTWKLTSDGVLTVTPTEQQYEGQTNMKNYWKVNGVLTLPWSAYAEQITKVVLEDGVNDIGQMAFYELPNLVEVVLPESVTEIRQYAFKNCKSLTTINLEVVDEAIREGAFYGCTALAEVNLAADVVIEDWAFTRVPGFNPAN